MTLKPSSKANAAAPIPNPTPRSVADRVRSAARDTAEAWSQAAERERKYAHARASQATRLVRELAEVDLDHSKANMVDARRNQPDVHAAATAKPTDLSKPVQPGPTFPPLPVGLHSVEPAPSKHYSRPIRPRRLPQPTAAPISKSNPVKPSQTFTQLSVGRPSVEPRACQTSSTPGPSPTRPSLATASSTSNPVKPGQASAPPSAPNQPNTRKPTHGRARPDVTTFPTKLTAAGETAPHPAPPGQGQSRLVQPKHASIPPSNEPSAHSVARFV
jgi:hypothetical protein